ncbi:MAG TPA: kelch repeat-containing protein [Candidatus Dormibacteraeota bacterium]|nr:kelch repeat-containing protein [Candidatus Dormibacteraeota bacterium]
MAKKPAIFAMLLFLLAAGLGAVSFQPQPAANPGAIAAIGHMTIPRFFHTATLLKNNKVLIAGGMQRNGMFEGTAEIYDPATRSVTAAGKLQSVRGWGTTATLLPNGKVLITGGGVGASSHLSTAELYDPATGKFTATGNMAHPRAGGAAVLLRTGKVLVMGGYQSSDVNPNASAEIYDPATSAFSRTGDMHVSRSMFAAVLLNDGKVLVVGGASAGQYPDTRVEASAEIYDPATGRFSTTGQMSVPRYKVAATLLLDGRVMVIGGADRRDARGAYNTTEIYDPKTGSFASGPAMHFKRYKLPAGVITLDNGMVLVAGGAEQPEVYDPSFGSFLNTAGAELKGFYFSSTSKLANGKVLILGGYGRRQSDGAVDQALEYQPGK